MSTSITTLPGGTVTTPTLTINGTGPAAGISFLSQAGYYTPPSAAYGGLCSLNGALSWKNGNSVNSYTFITNNTTARNYTLPNAHDSFVMNTFAATLTNKTIIGGVANGNTIDANIIGGITMSTTAPTVGQVLQATSTTTVAWNTLNDRFVFDSSTAAVGANTTIKNVAQSSITITLPGINTTLVGEATVNTLQNKTLDDTTTYITAPNGAFVQFDSSSAVANQKLTIKNLSTVPRILEIPNASTQMLGTDNVATISNKIIDNTNTINTTAHKRALRDQNIFDYFFGSTYQSYGHTWSIINQSSFGLMGFSSVAGYPIRVSKALNSVSTFNNNATTTLYFEDLIARMTASSGPLITDAGRNGVASLMMGEFQIARDRANPLGEVAFKNGLRTWIALMGIYTSTNSNSGSVTRNGTWTAVSSTGVWQGTCYKTTTTGSSLTYGNLPRNATGFAILVIGLPDDTGTTYEVTLSGNVVASGTTSNQGFIPSSYSANLGQTMAIIVKNLPVGIYNPTITNTGTGILMVSIAFPIPTFPQMIIYKAIKNVSTFYANGISGTPASSADVDRFNGYIDNVLSEWSERSDYFTVVDPNAGWDPAVHMTIDKLRPNDPGQSYLARLALDGLGTITTFKEGSSFTRNSGYP